MSQRELHDTKPIEAADASAAFDRLLDAVSGEGARFSVERGGRPVAVIVSVDDFDRLALLEQERAERFSALDRSWQTFANLKDDDATVDRKVAEAVAAAREKRRKGPRRDITA
jgi:prevent-host-death family protein